MTFASAGTPSDLSVSRAALTTSQSDLDPIRMATRGLPLGASLGPWRGGRGRGAAGLSMTARPAGRSKERRGLATEPWRATAGVGGLPRGAVAAALAGAEAGAVAAAGGAAGAAAVAG